MTDRFLEWCVRRGIRRYLRSEGVPDFTIGRKDNPQVYRWYGIPKNPLFNIYFHEFLRSDADFALHDHPWLCNLSILLDGRYLELMPDPSKVRAFGLEAAAGRWPHVKTLRIEGDRVFRWGKAPHRIELIDGEHCFTVFITGPRVPEWLRSWGFYCNKGFVPFRKIIKYRNKVGSEPLDGCP